MILTSLNDLIYEQACGSLDNSEKRLESIRRISVTFNHSSLLLCRQSFVLLQKRKHSIELGLEPRLARFIQGTRRAEAARSVSSARTAEIARFIEHRHDHAKKDHVFPLQRRNPCFEPAFIVFGVGDRMLVAILYMVNGVI